MVARFFCILNLLQTYTQISVVLLSNVHGSYAQV